MNIKIQYQIVLYAFLAVGTAIATHIIINWNSTIADPLSYRLGMEVGANLRTLNVDLNFPSFMQGLTDGASSGNPAFASRNINNATGAVNSITIHGMDYESRISSVFPKEMEY